MEKLNRVGRSENLFILFKILYGDNKMEKKNFKSRQQKIGMVGW